MLWLLKKSEKSKKLTKTVVVSWSIDKWLKLRN